MPKVTPEEQRALLGHPNMAEILAVLESPVEPRDCNDWRNGYVVYNLQVEDHTTIGLAEEEGQRTVHTLDHWRGPQDTDDTGAPRGTRFDLGAYNRHESAQREARAKHGLEFLQRPHRKGPYVRTGSKTRALVNAAYIEQHNTEWN